MLKMIRLSPLTSDLLVRAITVLREEGIKSFWFKSLSEMGYRRYLLLERMLDDPISHTEARMPITIDLLKKTEADEYSMFKAEVRQSEIIDRINSGHWCFVARHRGKIISATWAAANMTVRSYYLNREIHLGQDEVYTYNSFTEPDFRGLSVSPALKAEMMRYFRSAGYRRMICWVSPENRSSLKALRKAGFHPLGMMGCVRVGPWRKDFYRVINP
jgi:RimJ/RimL family protein N-acetyltransferase